MKQSKQPTVTEVEQTLIKGTNAVKKTTEKRWLPNNNLTRKENAFIKYTVENPKQTATEAAIQSYNTDSRRDAANIAAQLMKKPKILAELSKYSTDAEYNLVKLAKATTEYALEGGRDGAAYAAVSERVNNGILDRLHGKATQRVEASSLAVTLNIDLTTAAA